jgi:hypothetical protein
MRLNFLLSEFKKAWLVTSIGVVLLVVGSTILSVNEGKKSENCEIFVGFLFLLVPRSRLQSQSSPAGSLN